jgi:hypothetical protein
VDVAEESLVLQLGGQNYRWIEDWIEMPPAEDRQTAWPHTGIVTAADDRIITFDTAGSAIIELDAQGHLTRSMPVDVGEAHGITMVEEDGTDFLWLADATVKKIPAAGYASDETARPRVIKIGPDGRIVRSLENPPHAAYTTGHYRPTCVAVAETRFGGNGDIWVGDGYGESYVHRYDAAGNYIGSLSGEEGAGRFSVPHALIVDRRHAEPELYIADRAKARIQVYGLDGRFRRVIEGFLSRPTWFARNGDALVVVEFTPPRLTVLDAEDRLVGYLGEGPVIIDRPGWPNELDTDGKPRRPSVRQGQLNSPHSVAADSVGNLYVSEYMIGGRTPKLQRIP